MRLLCASLLSALLALALAATVAPAARAGQAREAGRSVVGYELSMPEPATHLYRVRLTVDAAALRADHVDLVMPVWTPGSYLVREFARHVQDFEVSGPQATRWEKIDKSTWRVWTGGSKERLAVSYRVYANEPSVRTSHLDDSHGYLNGANLFMYVDGFKDRPVLLSITAPTGWDVATTLEERSGAGGRAFYAPDYDRLVDSPIEMGHFERLRFEALGRPHEIVVWGRGNYDPVRLTADVKKIVETAGGVFGGTLPYDRYTFILHLFAGGGGSGLEHLSSTTLDVSPFVFAKKESYQDFLELVAHEFFHAWLVKRIHPTALGPFDYTAENYTKMIWLMEGGTEFYGTSLVRRAGLLTDEDYNKKLAGDIKTLQQTPGRRHMSLEEASFDAWIKYYRPNENSVNSQVSYYLKGSIVAAMLDLEIRGRTSGAKSLDDVLRLLYETYAKRGAGVPEDALQPAVETVAGGSFAEFFDRYVRGTDEIDYNRFLAHAGLRLVAEVKKDDSRLDPSKPGAWLGANLADVAGRTTVSSILEESPAWRAGLNAGDELLAVDGVRTTAATLPDRLAERAPGDRVTVTVFRRDELRTLTIPLAERPPDTYRIEKIAAAKPAEKPVEMRKDGER